MKEWLQKHWPIIVAVVVILTVFFISRYNNKEYKREIKGLNDFNERLMEEYRLLEDSAAASKEQLRSYKIQLAVYQDSLQDSQNDYFNQQKRYEKAMADLSRIPTDDLYVDVTGWLDSLSVHW